MHFAFEGHKLCCTLELPIELLKCWLPQTHARPITWVPGQDPDIPSTKASTKNLAAQTVLWEPAVATSPDSLLDTQ